MRNPECVPEDYVCVFDVGVGVLGYPFGETFGGGAGGLGDVPAGGVELVVLVCEAEGLI